MQRTLLVTQPHGHVLATGASWPDCTAGPCISLWETSLPDSSSPPVQGYTAPRTSPQPKTDGTWCIYIPGSLSLGRKTQRCVFFTGSQSSPAELSFSYPQSRSACSRELYRLTFHLFSLPHFLSKYFRYHFPNKVLVPKFSLRVCFWEI